MNFLKNLFSGGPRGPQERAIYVYVRPKRCDEIVQVRIDTYNDLSLNDEGNGYWVRKIASAIRCPFQAEVTLYFNKSRQITESSVENGELVDQAVYEAYMAEKEA